ncbi:hypothetical protein D5F11_011765 [Siminovitchia terrae]|uniref:O-antigen translocase n=1 Tax=Siminovitchia terrae TaxID=1914933 RepID=A0A429X7X5_SIMTE|nr:oligosaccharide flippase family protein [Siminovitchia terrae]RST59499.1 hypothetical protein D5F11_011765 [Siminovitchia terrae]
MEKVKKEGFFSKVIKLFTATALGQLIFFLASPLLTRLYSPEAFGDLAVFISLVSILSIAISWRYELAIPIPKEENKAIVLVVLSCLLVVANGILIFILSGLYYFADYDLFNINKTVLLILPISVIGAGLYKVFNHWYIRQDNFNIISRSKLSQSVSQTITQVALGFLASFKLGLIVGDFFGRTAGTLNFIRTFLSGRDLTFKKLRFSKFIKVAKEYKEFPIYSGPGALLNTISTQAPPLAFSILFGSGVAGFYSLAYRVISGPVMMIGQAISQVYLQKLSSITRDKGDDIKQLYLTVSKRLFLIALLPTIIIFLFSDYLFGMIFGSQWSKAGIFSSILIIMVFFQFIVSPTSQTLIILQKQKIQAIWEGVRFLLITILFIASYYYSLNEYLTLIYFTVVMSVMYIVMFVLCLIMITNKSKS